MSLYIKCVVLYLANQPAADFEKIWKANYPHLLLIVANDGLSRDIIMGRLLTRRKGPQMSGSPSSDLIDALFIGITYCRACRLKMSATLHWSRTRHWLLRIQTKLKLSTVIYMEEFAKSPINITQRNTNFREIHPFVCMYVVQYNAIKFHLQLYFCEWQSPKYVRAWIHNNEQITFDFCDAHQVT